jgi:hypothetical protein
MSGLDGFRRVAADLSAVSLAEARHRAAAAGSRALGLYRWKYPAGRLSDQALKTAICSPHAASAQEWHQHLHNRQTPSFFFDRRDRERFSAALSLLGPATLERADQLLGDTFIAFGQIENLPYGRDWHRDPASGYSWSPGEPWWALDPIGPDGTDVRRVWELSRQRDLFVLGRAYWRTSNRKYADAASVRLASWLQANPPELGINWSSGLEIGIRGLAWIWALQLFADVLDAALTWELTGALISAAKHLEQSLPYTQACMPGNHVVGEAVALGAIGFFLPEVRGSRRWRATALQLVEREAQAQVLSDGFHVEQSPSYHVFVWELFQTIEGIARRNGCNIPRTRQALETMSDSIAGLCRPNRTSPDSGDNDQAAAYDLDESHTALARLAAVAAVQFGRGDLKGVAIRPVEDLIWLHGMESMDVWHRLVGDTPPHIVGPHTLGAAYRTDWSEKGDYIFMRGGGLTRHTHADALHLELSIEGVPLLIDAGTGAYNESAAERRHFRGTLVHNTITIDDASQATPHRSFRWQGSLEATWRVCQEIERGAYFDAEHNGYDRVGVRHRRQVLWQHGWGVLVLDTLWGTGTHDVGIQWLFDGAVEIRERDIRVQRDGTSVLSLAVHPLKVDRADARTSSRYGTLRHASSVVGRCACDLPFAIGSFFHVTRGRLVQVEVEVSRDADGWQVASRVGPTQRTFHFPSRAGVAAERSYCAS